MTISGESLQENRINTIKYPSNLLITKQFPVYTLSACKGIRSFSKILVPKFHIVAKSLTSRSIFAAWR